MPFVFNPIHGTFDAVKDVSGYVPYVGADRDLNLGNNDLTSDSEIISRNVVFRDGLDTAGLSSGVINHWNFRKTLLDSVESKPLEVVGETRYNTKGFLKSSLQIDNNGYGILDDADVNSTIEFSKNWTIGIVYHTADLFGSFEIISKNTLTSSSIKLRTQSAGDLAVDMNGFGSVSGTGSLGSVSLNSTNTLTISHDAAAKRFTVISNGVATTTRTYTNTPQDGKLMFGTFLLNSNTFFSNLGIPFFLESLTIWDRVLSSSESVSYHNLKETLVYEGTNDIYINKISTIPYSAGSLLYLDENGAVTPTDGLFYNIDQNKFTVSDLSLNENFAGKGKLELNYLAKKISVVPETSLIKMEDKEGDVDISNGIVLGRSNITTGSNSLFILGATNNINASFVGNTLFLIGDFNTISDFAQNIFILGRVNSANSVLAAGGYIIGQSNQYHLFTQRTNVILGNDNRMGVSGNDVFSQEDSNTIIGSGGFIESGQRRCLFSLNQGIVELTEHTVDNSFLFATKGATGQPQQNILHLEHLKGARVGATSGETITMTGKDLYVDGQVEAHGYTKDIKTLAINTTLGANNDVVICTGTITITLPAATSYTGKEYTIKNKGTGLITVSCNASETIDGNPTQSLTQHESITVISDGTEWWIL